MSPSNGVSVGETGVDGGSMIYVVMVGEGVGEAIEEIVGVVGMLLELGIGSVTPSAVA